MSELALYRRSSLDRLATRVLKKQARDKDECALCGAKAAIGLTADHWIPLSKGGTNEPDNLCMVCAACNGFKGDLIPGVGFREVTCGKHGRSWARFKNGRWECVRCWRDAGCE